MSNEPLDHAECPQCGWLGVSTDVLDHPQRPMPMDFGFCPQCMGNGRILEIEPITKTEFDRILAEYD